MPFEIECRGGRTFSVRPDRTALLVIDMQKDFLFDADGRPGPMTPIIPMVANLTSMLREAGCRIIHTREAYRPDLSDVTPLKAGMAYVGRPGPFGRRLIRGETGCDFVDDLRPEANETVLDKPSFGAFCTTELHEILQSAGLTHLIFCGVTMQCCVHSTLREAVDRGYWCLTLADCCGALQSEWHSSTLSLIESEDHLFGWICDLSDLRAAIPAGAEKSA